MQIFSSKMRKLESILFLALISSIFLFGNNFFSISDFSDPNKLAELIGPYGYIGIIATQFAQVLIAPLPPVTPVVSGMLYGVVTGTILSVIGAALGSLVAILVGRMYGRHAVNRFLSESSLNKFDKYTSNHGYLPFVVLFIFPGFPDDALCFIAGLTTLDWKKLFILASLGRIPGIMLLTMTESSAATANTSLFIASAAAIAGISVFSVKYEQRIEKAIINIEEESIKILDYINPSRGLLK